MLLPPHLFCVFRYIRPRAAQHEPSVKKRLNRPRRLFFARRAACLSAPARLRRKLFYRHRSRVFVAPRVASNEPYARNKGESRARRLSVHASFTSAPARKRRFLLHASVLPYPLYLRRIARIERRGKNERGLY